MNNAEIIELTHRHMVDVYGCLPLAFARGHGAYLYDADGNRYLDFFCGLAVTSLGHGNPRVVRAIKEQAEKLTHVSNVFHTEPTARLVERLANHFGDGKVFLGNSGAEANEAAIKLARRWGSNVGGGRFEILTTLGSFHGRTLATVTATGQERYHQGFQPLMPGRGSSSPLVTCSSPSVGASRRPGESRLARSTSKRRLSNFRRTWISTPTSRMVYACCRRRIAKRCCSSPGTT